MLAAAGAAMLLTGGDARADQRPMAAPEVREILSTEARGHIVRAIVAEHRRGPSLTVELLDGDRGRGALRHQERISSYVVGRDRRALHAEEIRLEGFRGSTLRFEVRERRGEVLRCTYDTLQRRSIARCRPERRATPAPAPRPLPTPEPPPRSDWRDHPRVQQACERAVIGRGEAQACLDAVATASFEPSSLIRACERAVTGSRAVISCVRAGASARQDPSSAVAACERAVTGSDAVIACVGQAGKTSFDLSDAIAACGRALTGSSSVLRCVDLAASARRDPSPVIAHCERNEAGSQRTLQCIEREVSRSRY
jgi:hypothetical protein